MQQIIIIICEGQTEQEFVRSVLQPVFENYYFQTPLVGKGGIVKWATLKQHIERHLKENKKAIVTTLFDFYGIDKKHDFPQWEHLDTIDRVSFVTRVEKGMKVALDEELRYRFIPYIQLHEFEGLLFNRIEPFKILFKPDECNHTDIEQIIREHPNPETINNGKATAPSKRLEQHIPQYTKILHGCLIAEHIGLNDLRTKAPRFNQWLTQLEHLAVTVEP
ncbi:MAG: DUF4276 family protein [Bacteroidales bacterium]|nr:DUF4276 family protein [Bacteroidales bacterium]